MTRQERAKQFMPFDALKGLQVELRKREEKHLRVDKIELSEESQEELSVILRCLRTGMDVSVKHYERFHYVETQGVVERIDLTYRYLMVDDKRIYFEEIYAITL